MDPADLTKLQQQLAAAGARDALTQQLIDSREQAAAATAAAIAGGSTTRPATENALPAAPDLSTFSYAQDGGRFADDVRAALARTGDQQVPWIEATDTNPRLVRIWRNQGLWSGTGIRRAPSFATVRQPIARPTHQPTPPVPRH